MNNKIIVGVATLSMLSACSTVKEAFPDKEKDYQFTKEIPKLTLPSDLAGGGGALTPPPSSGRKSATRSEESSTAVEDSDAELKASAEAELKEAAKNAPSKDAPAEPEVAMIPPQSVTVELLESSSKIAYLRINTPFTQAWRMVSKGLSRKSIEVTERNQADKTITVQFDPDEKPIEDGSYANELNFILNGFQSGEKEYLLKLVETNKQTDVVIVDNEQKPVSTPEGLKLLKSLHQSIKANLAGK